MLIKIIFCTIIGVLLTKWMLISVYCHTKKKRDCINISKKRNETLDQGTFVNLKARIKSQCDSYLYGLTRYESILVGQIPSMRVRKFFYKNMFAMEIDKKTVIYGGCELRSPWKIKLGRCVIGVANVLDGRNGIIIEDGACLGSSVYIWTEQHDVNDKYFRCNDKGCIVIIKKHAWICSRSTILPKVTIGEGAVVACGAVVSRECDDFGVYCGIPARKTKERTKELDYEVCNGYWHFY